MQRLEQQLREAHEESRKTKESDAATIPKLKEEKEELIKTKDMITKEHIQ